MTDFRKLMRMASEHTAQVETEYARKQRRSPAPTSTNARQTLQGSPRPSSSLKDLQQRTARIIQEAQRELRQKPSVARTPPAVTCSPNAPGKPQRTPAKKAATVASATTRSSAGKTSTKRTAAAAPPRRSLETPRSPTDFNRQPVTKIPPTKGRAAQARMSYTDLLKQAPDRLDVRRPNMARPSSQTATDIRAKPLSKATSSALTATSKSDRASAALTSARRTNSTNPLGRKPTASRRAAPEPALDLVPLKRADRDRRTIEEVQLASRRKRQATATRETSSTISATRPAVKPHKRPRARSPSPIAESRRPRSTYAGKKVPSASLSEHSNRVPQKRPPAAANGVPGKRPAPLTSTTPKSKTSTARTRVPANVTSTSPSMSARRPSGYQYGGKRPPTGSAQTTRQVRQSAPPPRPNYPGRRSLDGVRSRYAGDDEYDSDLDDFIVDDDEDSDGQGYGGGGRTRSSVYAGDEDSDNEQHQVSSVLKDLFGYDRSKYANGADDDYDDDDMETSAHTLRLEEARSARIARQEDEREEELERQAEERRRRRRMQKQRA
ncbi:hypothetical protein H4R34_004786 [Dimargaris verticillata]|uniref:SPT2 chromatin protein n=1 Tax=Dimargaris verticillata TaxID=2761393 RepID=A0A9W8E7S5_9FUNG|nr:hypothetical protein H4R34_004786 [Dimargaris verticillata]